MCWARQTGVRYARMSSLYRLSFGRNGFKKLRPSGATLNHADHFFVSQVPAISSTIGIHRPLRILATLPGYRNPNGESGVKIRAIITAMLVAVATPAFADISDYESMRSRLTDVLG